MDVGSSGTFQNEWQFAGLYNNNVLFSQVAQETRTSGKKLLIYDVNTQITQTIKIKYDTVGLGPSARFLLYRQGRVLHDHLDVLFLALQKETHFPHLNPK